MTDNIPNQPKATYTCVHCGTESDSAYCPVCGQHNTVSRITFSHILSEIGSSLLGLNGKFPKTVIGLIKKPGEVIKTYISGDRVAYMNPVGYYFLLFTILILEVSALGMDLSMLVNQSSMNQLFGVSSTDFSPEQLEAQERVRNLVFNAFQYITLLKFPFYALCARWFYKQSGFNFMEHMVFAFYVSAQQFLFLLLFFLIMKIFGISLSLTFTIVFGAYFIWATMMVYGYSSKWTGAIKALIFNLVSNLLFMMFFAVIVAIITLINLQ